jgi:glycosyltransferase involved in cell wall biosynthesis
MSDPPPLRAVFVDVPLIYHSGVTQVLSKIARYRQKDRLKVFVASLAVPQRSMVEFFESVDAKVDHLGNSGILQSAFRLRKLIHSESLDLVVANSFRSYLVGKVATLFSGKPVVYWIHTVNQLNTSRLKKLIFSNLARHDPLIYVSEAVGINNRPEGYRGQDTVIYNSVEVPESNPDWQPYGKERRGDFGLPEDAIVLGYMAHFVYYKDHATLLRAFDAMAKKHPRLYLILIGNGPDYGTMTRLADQLDSRDRILFLGARKDARAVLGLIDIYVHVATEEAFGLAVVEAMLARRPVVAARAFALPELIQDGETGLLFEPRNLQDLEEKITQLIEDPAYAARLAQAAAESGRRNFPPEPFARQVTAFLQGVTTSRSTRAVLRES